MRTKHYTLRDGEPFELSASEIFRYSCCDCGLVHRAVIAREKNGKLGFAVERDLPATRRRRHTKQIRMNIWLLVSMLGLAQSSRLKGKANEQ